MPDAARKEGSGTGFAPLGDVARDAELVLYTHGAALVSFAVDRWELTARGVRGHAMIQTQDGLAFETDTTIAYGDVASAASGSGRGTLLSQFLLTILGVILVIGLAAIILYAAFLATDR